MDILDEDITPATHYGNSTVDYSGSTNTTCQRNVNIGFHCAPTMQNNIIGTPLTSPTTPQSVSDSLSSMVCVTEGIGSPTGQINGRISLSNSAENGEIVIGDFAVEHARQHHAQSPVVLKDQLQKLREFDDFVDALDNRNGTKGASIASNGTNLNQYEANVNGKDVQTNAVKASDGFHHQRSDVLSAESSSEGSPATIIIDDDCGGLGGLMGLVSISPAITPVKKNNNSSQNTGIDSNERTNASSGFSSNGTKQSNHNNDSTSHKLINMESTDLVTLFDPHAPAVQSPPSTIRKQSWVLFEEDDNDDKLSTSSRGTSISSSSVKYQGMLHTPQFSPQPIRSHHGGSYGSGLSSSPAGSGFVKDWVRFEAHSPRSIPNSPVVTPQYTGE